MKLTRRTMPEFYEALRQALGRFDMELVETDGRWLREHGDTDDYQILIKPFADHKPFYTGQK